MSPRFLLIASEHALNRESLVRSLELLRPEIPVQTAVPAEVDNVVSRKRPWLVICSSVTEVIDRLTPAWIELHPLDTPYTTISVAGERSSIATPNPTFEELLRIIDDVWGLQLKDSQEAFS